MIQLTQVMKDGRTQPVDINPDWVMLCQPHGKVTRIVLAVEANVALDVVEPMDVIRKKITDAYK